jgi:hypothetical protein
LPKTDFPLSKTATISPEAAENSRFDYKGYEAIYGRYLEREGCPEDKTS